MKQKFLQSLLIAALLFLVFLPAISLAVNPMDDLKSATPQEIKSQSSLESLVVKIITAVIEITGIILLLLVIYGGAVWGTAGGDSAKVAKAKNIIIYAAIGVFIIGSAYAITIFILNSLNIQ